MVDRINSIHWLTSRKNGTKASGIQSYLKILSLLKNKGILGNPCLYIPIGFDFFPALFVQVYGFNNREIGGVGFFAKKISGYDFKTRGWTEKLKNNLNYKNVVDAKNLAVVKKELSKGGFFDSRRRKSLIFNYVINNLFVNEYDSDYERYRENPNYLSDARSWFNKLLGFFNKGDTIIVFDDDVELFPHRRCQKMLEFGREPHFQTEIFLSSPNTVKTYLYLPAKAHVFEIK